MTLFWSDAAAVWKTLLIVILPIASSPILFIDGSKEMSCLYVIVIMGVTWITEALPIPVTALLPIVLFPLLGVAPAVDVATSFMKDTMMFSFCCLTFAMCIEKWNLHRRIAMTSLLLVGSSPRWLILGFMLPTWFMSMWVNNTSATAMMIPVVSAVIKQLAELDATRKMTSSIIDSSQYDDAYDENEDENDMTKKSRKSLNEIKQINHSEDVIDPDTDPKSNYVTLDDSQHLCKALCLSVCYSATIGGVASLTGTSTNLVMQGQADEVFASYGLESGVNFMTWMMCCLPLSLTCVIIAWIWLVIHFFGIRELLSSGCGDQSANKATQKVVREELAKLGPFTFAEKAVLGHFLLMLSLWLTLKTPGGYGWGQIFLPGYVTNSTPAILIVASLFVFSSGTNNEFTGKQEPLMTWQFIHDYFSWNTWLLLGGGLAMASACQTSGLSSLLGTSLTVISVLPPWLMLLLLSMAISFMTEITSNTATASILGPVMAQLAMSLQVNPLFFLFATAVSCSMAFMLPIATPANAIAFATGYIRIKDMVKAGIVLNILCVVITCIFMLTWFTFLLDLDILPPAMMKDLDVHNNTLYQSNNTLNATFSNN